MICVIKRRSDGLYGRKPGNAYGPIKWVEDISDARTYRNHGAAVNSLRPSECYAEIMETRTRYDPNTGAPTTTSWPRHVFNLDKWHELYEIVDVELREKR